MDNSDAVSEAKKTLMRLVSSNTEPSAPEFIKVRDYLLTYLIFDNCTRPAGMYNMEVGEFKKAKQSSGYVIQVRNHKTDYDGPINMSISGPLFKELSFFVEFCRNKLEGIGLDNSGHVFTSSVGRKMSSSLVNMQFKSFYKKATGKDCITSTIVRKFTTTKVHIHHKSMKEDVARYMNHDLCAATENYELVDRKRKPMSITNRIHNLQRERDDEEYNIKYF